MAPKPERLSPRQAADALGITKKAVEQAIQRDAFPNAERVPNPNKPGHVLRVWIPRSDVEAYAASRAITLKDVPLTASDSKRRPSSTARPSAPPARVQPGQQTIWQELAQELSQENLELKARVRELEQRLAREGG